MTEHTTAQTHGCGRTASTRLLHSRYAYSLGRHQQKPQAFFYLAAAAVSGIVTACVHIIKHPEIDPWFFVSIVLLGGDLGIVMCKHHAYKHERLILSPEQLIYWSPLPKLLRWHRPGWSLRWTDIRAATLLPPEREPNLTHLVLQLETSGRKRTVMPLQWVDPQGDDQLPESRLAAVLLDSPDEALRATLRHAPLIQHLRARDIPVNLDAVTQRHSVPFALDAHPHSRAALVLIVSLFFYCKTETISAREIYVAGAFWMWYIGIGGLAAGLTALWLCGTRVPAGTSLGLGVLLGGVLIMALFPGALRLNQLTDTAGLRPFTYVLQPDRSLQPQDPNLPILRLERYYTYWHRLEPGSVYRVYLRRGALGFHQVDLRPFDALAERIDD